MKSARRFRFRGLCQDRFLLDEATSRKARNVLRLSAGDAVTIVDDSGTEYACRIIGDCNGLVEIEKSRQLQGRPAAKLFELTVVLSVIKGDRMDWAIEKLAETAIARIQPFIAERCVVKNIPEAKLDRWRRIATAAALQSGTGLETALLEPTDNLDRILTVGPSWYLDRESESVKNLLLDGGHRVATNDFFSLPKSILIGPEGGWSDSERPLLIQKSFGVSLGNHTFRAETAAILAAFLASLVISNH